MEVDDSYRFGPIHLDLEKRLIRRGPPINRSHLRFAILKALIDAEGRTVSYGEFVRDVWENGGVADHGIGRAIALLKRDLGEYGDCIRCDPGVGYFFSRPPSENTTSSPLEPTTCPAAMDRLSWLNYRIGLQEVSRRTEDSLRRAVRCFETALSHSPDYVPARIYLAESLVLLSHSGYQVFDPRMTMPRIQEQIRMARAFQLDSKTAAAVHALSAKVRLLFSFDFEGAAKEFKRSVELDSTYAPSYHGLAHVQVTQGKFDEAFNSIERAHECDPLSPMLLATPGWLCYFAGDYEEGVERLKRALTVHSHFPPGHVMLGLNLEALGRYEEAIKHYKISLELQLSSVPLGCLGHVYGRAGRNREARGYLKRLRTLGEERFVSAFFFAQVHLGLGDCDQALSLLEQAYDERADWLMQLGLEPRWRPLHSDRRFTALLQKIGVHQYSDRQRLKNPMG